MAFTYGLIMGIGSGMSMMVGRVTWAHYYGRHGLGRVQGSAMMVSIVGSALGPVTLAAIRDRSDDYTPALLTMIALMLSALIMMVLYRPRPVEGV
jgi:MFS family permease